MTNLNFRSEIAIKDISDIDEGFKFSQTFPNRIENKHILACLDEKYHCNSGLYILEECLYPRDYQYLRPFFNVFGTKRPWMSQEDPIRMSQDDPITHIKEKMGKIFVVIQERHVVCLKYERAWYSNPFILQYTFQTDGPCKCVAHYQDGVIACIKFPQEFTSATSSPQLHIFDKEGKLQHHIVYYDGKPIFNDPQDIAVDDNHIIVSDQGDKSVIFLGRNGSIIHKFRHKEMSCPRGLCIDQFSNIYIATDGKIIQLTKDYSQSRVLVSLPNQKISFLHFCEETNLLSMNYDETGKIVNYQFLQNNQVTNRNREARRKTLRDHPPYLLFAGVCLVYIYLVMKLPKN